MTHSFKIGDTVRLNGTTTQGRVKGFSPKDRELVLCEWTQESLTSYVPAKSLTMVEPTRENNE